MRAQLIAFGITFAFCFAIVGLLVSKPAAIPIAEPTALPIAEPTTVEAAPPAEEIPIGNRLLYRLARDKAAELYAKQNGITEVAARAKLAKVSDASLHTAVKAAKLTADMPVVGDLEGILRWIIDHQDLIIAIAKLLITLLALL